MPLALENKLLPTKISFALWTELYKVAADRGVSKQDIVRLALGEYVKRELPRLGRTKPTPELRSELKATATRF